MKTVKSFAKIVIALLMALTLMTLTACDVLDDFFGKGGSTGGGGEGPGGDTTYTVTLNLDGGSVQENLTSYTAGTATTLPIPTKNYYKFEGWHEGSLSGNVVTEIPSTATGNMVYYAEWTPKTYSVTLTINDDPSYQNTVTSYTYGTGVDLPSPTKNGYNFNGWYVNSDLKGSKVSVISASEHENKTFYGEWVSQGTTAKKWTVTLNDNGGTYKGTQITGYTEGVGADLPQMEKANCNFDGWCENKNLSDNPVFSISASATGDKEYWAKFTPVSADALQLSAYGGYEEGAYVEFTLDSSVSLDKVTISYISNDGTSKTISDNDKTYLVRRITDDTVRADIVGIAEGTCQITVSANGKTTTKTVNVDKYDRSGYAHFNYTGGVGAYNDDGTPKNNAYVIYVDEANKNSVVAPWNSKKVGIAYILSDLRSANKPVIIRVVGKVSAATWDKNNWETLKAQYKSAEKTSDGKKIKNDSSIVGINGKQLPTSESNLTQEKLISEGYNKLQTDITVLEGLSSKAIYSSSAGESGYDSCWNNCSISEASNVTFEGIGTNAELFQWGLTWSKCNSIEVRNVTFDDYTEDACSFEGNADSTTVEGFAYKRFWIHHCTFNQGINYWDICAEQDKGEGDGATDFKRLAYVTLSYNHYYNNHKTGLIGADDKSLTANVTFHHNYYEICQSRLPLARRANMHMYNNYYYGTTNTCLSIRSGGYAFIEYCYFENAKNPIETKVGTKKLSNELNYLQGFVKVFNCRINSDSDWSSGSEYIKVTKDRTAQFANDNIYNQYFDTSSTDFYYDTVNSKSNVTNLITDISTIPIQIPNLAGVHKNK